MCRLFISGYGITQYRVVEQLIFGLLTKSLSFTLHRYLIYPTMLVLIMHLYFSCGLLRYLRKS